jgi:hypothetical protein
MNKRKVRIVILVSEYSDRYIEVKPKRKEKESKSLFARI